MNSKSTSLLSIIIMMVSILVTTSASNAAYDHKGEMDSKNFISVYHDKAGTKLDNCNLCHTGGSYQNSSGKLVTLGSCQWCHYSYGYGEPHGNIDDTLNPYGKDYKSKGSNVDAVKAIEGLDSDGDGYSNAVEIAAVRYPGNPKDDPTKVPAPSMVYTREQIEQMPQHTQFLLMNTHKSIDYYGEYTGVTMESFLGELLLPTATGIIVYAADGFAQFHPLYPDPDPLFYHVFGDYPQAMFYHDVQADKAKSSVGWCDYSAASVEGRNHGDPIVNPLGQKLLLAIKYEGNDLQPGKLDASNKLVGEGPFRVVPPQKNPGPPDQKSTNSNSNLIWPFDSSADHSAGYSSKCVTMINVQPLPEGTTDIDALEAGWPYIDAEKIVVYGSIDPVPNIKDKLTHLMDTVAKMPGIDFKQPSAQRVLQQKLDVVLKQIEKGNYSEALDKLQNDIISKLNGCSVSKPEAPDKNDWTIDCDTQKELYWPAYEIAILLKIVA
jgi:hypothetical protein